MARVLQMKNGKILAGLSAQRLEMVGGGGGGGEGCQNKQHLHIQL